MEVVVFGEGSSDDEMRCGRVQEQFSNYTDFTRSLWKVNIYAQSEIRRRMFRFTHKFYEPSISAGLSKSIRRMRPVERARMRTLLATSAATKSDGMPNWSETLSMLNMGRDASTS